MSETAAAADPAGALLALYDRALPEVFGYLQRRCPSEAVAEDLTADTFLAAVAAARRGQEERLTTAWLVRVARNKLVDHWRRQGVEERGLRLAGGDDAVGAEPDWTEELEEQRALSVLHGLGAHHQAALTLRYLDGLSVPEVGQHLGRTVHATEALLVRARRAFRSAYGDRGDHG